jgi:aryl-alcohol dehydrogenase-like predicted oxidoreductase
VATDVFGASLFKHTEANDSQVHAALVQVAEARGAPLATVALAWLLQKPGVTAPIIGVSKLAQYDEAVGALDLALTAEEVAALEAAYLPHAVVGF